MEALELKVQAIHVISTIHNVGVRLAHEAIRLVSERLRDVPGRAYCLGSTPRPNGRQQHEARERVSQRVWGDRAIIQARSAQDTAKLLREAVTHLLVALRVN